MLGQTPVPCICTQHSTSQEPLLHTHRWMNTHCFSAALLGSVPASALQASESSSWQRAIPGGPTQLATDTQIPIYLNLGSPPPATPVSSCCLGWMFIALMSSLPYPPKPKITRKWELKRPRHKLETDLILGR